MKSISTLVLAGTLAFAGAVSAEEAKPLISDPFVSTAGPAAGLTPGLIAAGIAITVIGIAALDSSGDT